jgi:2-methylcitrate dehydratase PrpD
VTLSEKRVTLDHFTDQKVLDPVIVSLKKKVNLIVDSELAKIGYRGTFNTIVKIKMNDGRKYTKRVDHSKGSPENPLYEDELMDKYINCARRALSEEKVNESVKMLKDLPQMADLTKLISVLS